MADNKVNETQMAILNSINAIVDSKLSNLTTPSVKVGIVLQDPTGYQCVVKLNEAEITCTLPEHLHNWVAKDDIVYVQDAYGNGQQYIVIGSSGTTKSGSMVIEDNDTGKFVSGVTKFEEPDGTLADNDFVIK